MAKNKNSSSISFMSLLAILFIALKLTKVIDWSWIWVLSPLWAGIVIFFSIFIIGILIAVIKEVIS